MTGCTGPPNGVPKGISEAWTDWKVDLSFHYYLLVCEYMSRNISFETDRLVAWSAISGEVGRRTNWEYLAGLWKQDMHRGLL